MTANPTGQAVPDEGAASPRCPGCQVRPGQVHTIGCPREVWMGNQPIVLTDEQEHQAARYLQDQTAIASIGLCRTFVRGMVKRVNQVRGAGL